MKLTILERLVLLNILPNQGSVTTVRIVSELRDVLSFSEEEHAALKFEQTPDGKGTVWDDAGEGPPADIAIGPRAHALIAETLEALSKEEKFSQDYLGVWDKFCEEPAIREVG